MGLSPLFEVSPLPTGHVQHLCPVRDSEEDLYEDTLHPIVEVPHRDDVRLDSESQICLILRVFVVELFHITCVILNSTITILYSTILS